MAQSTNKELVEELEKRNVEGKYDQMIRKAKLNWYHDFKAPDEAPGGTKLDLVNDLANFPELNDIRRDVINGEYDESPDEEDKENMRAYAPKSLWKSLGL